MRDGFAQRLRRRDLQTIDVPQSEADSAPMQPPSGYVRPRVIFGVATALAFFSGFQGYYYVATFTDWPASLPFMLALNLGYWYSWACLTPGILWLSRWAPLERDTWKRAVAVHVPGVFIATTLHIMLTVGSQMLIVWLVGQEQRSWQTEARKTRLVNAAQQESESRQTPIPMATFASRRPRRPPSPVRAVPCS